MRWPKKRCAARRSAVNCPANCGVSSTSGLSRPCQQSMASVTVDRNSLLDCSGSATRAGRLTDDARRRTEPGQLFPARPGVGQGAGDGAVDDERRHLVEHEIEIVLRDAVA